MNKSKKIMIAVFCIMLIAASAMFYSCEDENKEENVLGKGSTSFKLEVVGDKGETKVYTIKTNEETVGDALIHNDVKLVPAADKELGYVTTVDGLTADWSVDMSYWSFYINGEYASLGAFDAEIEKDAAYKFEYVKETAGDEENAG